MVRIKPSDETGLGGMDPTNPFDESGLGGMREPGGGGPALVTIGSMIPPNATPTMFDVRKFPRGGWGSESWAMAVLADFASTDWTAGLQVPQPPPSSGLSELKDLIEKAGARPRLLGEIVAQTNNPLSAWADLLSVSPALARTWDVVVSASLIGQMVATHFKRINARPRPAQLAPSLLPPFLAPTRPSHPGGHATQAFLIGECLIRVNARLSESAMALAERISVNREYAGFNFASDTSDARKLASDVAARLELAPLFQTLLAEANMEWIDAPG